MVRRSGVSRAGLSVLLLWAVLIGGGCEVSVPLSPPKERGKEGKLLEARIYLPVFYNTGDRVEQEKLETTYREVLERFEGFSVTKFVEGQWAHKGEVFQDRAYTLDVVMADTEENRAWLKRYKETLAERFKQVEIFITVRPVERL